MYNFSRKPFSVFTQFFITTLLVVFAAYIRSSLNTLLGDGIAPFSFFFPAIMISTWFSGWRMGVYAILLSVLLAAKFFLDSVPDTPKEWVRIFTFILNNGLIVYFTDNLNQNLITRKSAERKLEDLNQNKIYILDGIRGCFFTVNECWEITHVNLHCQEYLPIPREETIGKVLWEIYPHWIDTKCYENLNKTQMQDEDINFEFYDVRFEKWYEIYASAFEKGLAIHFYDVSSRKKVESDLIETEEERKKNYETEFLISQILLLAPSFTMSISKILRAISENFIWDIGLFWKVDARDSFLHCTDLYQESSFAYDELDIVCHEVHLTQMQELPGKVWKNLKTLSAFPLSEDSSASRLNVLNKIGMQSAFAFPVFLKGEVYGIFEFFSRKNKKIDSLFYQTFNSIGSQISQYIEKKLAEERLKDAYEELEQRILDRTKELIITNESLESEILERKKVEEEVLEISLKEQRRFGSQLHDGLCQDLAGLLMLLRAHTKNYEIKGSLDVMELKNITEMLHQAVVNARNMARGLYPVEYEGNSLMASLEELVSRTKSLHAPIHCQFICPEPVLVSDNDIAIHLFRIAQESVNNAVKHGQANQVLIFLTKNEDEICLKIQDNGNGLICEVKNTKGIGLHIMKYRARMVNGILKFEKNPNGGAVVSCCLKA